MGCLGGNQLHSYILKFVSGLSVFTLSISPVWGQITPVGDTAIYSTADDSQINVTGGNTSADGTNLFHQFDVFNVEPLETVNFIAPATVDNILSRIDGGQISSIDGGLTVSNGANLWLINPAGIIFGPHAHLNLQGDFTAATADAVGFEHGWFSDGADYPSLVGSPQGFAFISTPGHLINLGNLDVAPGQNLTLLGGSVTNTGKVSAPDGAIAIAAVADSNRVSLRQTDQLLALEIEPGPDSASSIGATQLPTLLTGQGADHADTLTWAADGTLHLGHMGQSVAGLRPEAGHASVSGRIQSVGDYGGQITILGERISLIDATLNADGIYQGGDIYIGGNYQGKGPLPNATHTHINHATTLSANALQQGDGGQIIVWADQATYFAGEAQSQGGNLGGDGGFIEISGKSKLGFVGQFSLSAPQGEAGTILFDPDNILIVGGGTPADVAIESVLFPEVSAIDNDAGTLTLHAATLESWEGDDNIILQANDHIFVDLGGNNDLRFQPGSGSITFISDVDKDGIGLFYMTQIGDAIHTSGRDINVSGYAVIIETLDTRSADQTSAGNVNVVAPTLISIEGTLDADGIALTSDGINFNGGNDSIRGKTLSLATDDPSLDIYLGSNIDTSGVLDIEETEVLALKDGFADIRIGRADGTGNITLYNSVADGGVSPFQDPIHILGANGLQGPDLVTPWTITGTEQGNLNGLFSNGLSFENIDSIVVGNGTNDTLQGSAGDDIVVFSGVDAGSFNGVNFSGIQHVNGADGNDQFVFANGAVVNGVIDGGSGDNTLDYGAYITDVVIDLEMDSASGTGGFSNIQNVIGGSGANTIRGSSANDVVTLTGVGMGSFNSVAFQQFETVVPGDGDDRFVVNGGVWANLDGGAGLDSLDYSANTAGVTVDLATQTADNVTAFTSIENIQGSGGVDTLRGTSGDDVIAITGNNTGAVGTVTFSNIENLEADAGNDQIAIAPGANLTGDLDAGAGNDTLDYSGYSGPVTINLQTASSTAINTINNVETFVGSNNNDTLIGTNSNDTVLITGNNTGQFNSYSFTDIEHHDGGAGNDVFFFTDGASVTGTLTGGDGTDRANYNNYTTAIDVDFHSNSTTGTGGFATLESFIGGSNNDTFRLSAANPFKTIKGGSGSDTLIGDDSVGVWNLTAVNAGNGTGINNFSNIENLMAGNQSDQVNFFASGARFTGALDGGDGPLTLKGDSIGIGTAITGTGTLVLEPVSADKDINIGGPGLTPALDISTPELNTIDDTFTRITIGHPEGTGAITFGASVTLPTATTIQSPSGTINTQGFDLTASELVLSAAQEIVTANLTAVDGVQLTSDGAISTQNILTQGAFNGGNVVINAGDTLITQQINTTGTTGSGGNVTLNAPTAIQAETIQAEGNAAGGNVSIATNQFVQLTGQFTSLDGNAASISTAATNGTGEITIQHGGNSVTPFTIGDSNHLGSNAAITTGDFKLSVDSAFLNSYRLGNIALLTQDVTSPIEPPTLEPPIIEPPIITPVPSFEPSPTISFKSPLVDGDSSSIEVLTDSIGTDDSNKELFERLENSYSEQFKSHLDLYERVNVAPTNLDTAQQTLADVETLTGIKPGVLYVYFLPPTDKDKALLDSSGLNFNDELGLLLLTHNGQTVRRKIESVTRGDVMAIAEDFYGHITNSVSTASQYLPPAQQLYDWFITPIEDELQQQGIQSLAMAMDTGLRTLPVAALHSGEEFLVERYSLGVIPSFSLTDFNPQNFLYTQLDNTQLLAMGASQFSSQQLLPAVPEELTIVTQAFHDSEIFLNEDFTLDNLQHQVARNEFGIVHLASHGVFEPGEPSQSYIQLWDQPLQLDQVHTLGLQEANIALLVLSACNTALGDREAEYGFAGLAVNAGVQTSVASLWPISDEGTLGVMTYFYEHLQQQPVRATALRQAQLAMLRGDLQFADGTLYGLDKTALAHFPELQYHGRWNFEHPFYWSTYTLVGSPW